MKRVKIACLFLAACCVCIQFAGCRIGDTEIKLETGQLNSHKTVFQINDYKCDISLAKLYLCNYRNLYGQVYGLDLWKEGSTDSLETYVKDVTIQQLSRIVCMDLLAKQQEMKLSDEECRLVKAASEEYFDSLSAEERSYMGIHKKDVEKAYEDYALADKLYGTLTNGINEEVSDDEARVIRVQQIFVADEETANVVKKKLAAGEDFAMLAGSYNSGGEFERNVARGDYPQEVENIAYNLENDTCSEMIETDEGYYFIKCLSKYEEELTEANKEVIRIQREKEQFEDSYEEFISEATFRMNDTLWSEVSLNDTGEIRTDSFFDIFDKYFKSK
ncbi:MAG: peptidyl-prolyl cis-trans isomerase [Lachnospiraceae bacterium]|nr:peptidyl-prolyl cis-trans isomerase [Agathobacter sp.]MDD6291250.1 peptidyl-prolyl cis-trans isomerase [Lachnospiraceae bacterium]